MPMNLDPRIGTDAQSEHLDGLIFSGLLKRDARMNLVPDLAERWEMPDSRTYIFHLRRGVRFHNGQPLTSADVKYTYESILSGAIQTAKRGAFELVDSIETPDPWTVIFHLRAPYASFPWNLTGEAAGIVPRGSGSELSGHPVGSGPFRFLSARQDEYVLLERNPDYFGQPPQISRLRFRVVPDETVRALELRKGTGDIAFNSLTPDTVVALGRDPDLEVSEEPGTVLVYIAFNFNDPILAHKEVRQALAYATDRASMIRYLLRGQARLADSLLPPEHWAYEPNARRYDYDPARAEALLDAAGFPRGPNGVRFRLELKTSTDESARLLGAVLQEQWRRVGVALEVRSLELATLYSDVTHGSFQLYTLRWVGANLDPDIFEYVFSSKKMPPEGANRGHYCNPQLDALLEEARVETNQQKRKEIYFAVQKMVARDLPYLDLWYLDNICVHRRRTANISLNPAGDFEFLASVRLE